MAGSVWATRLTASTAGISAAPRHSAIVRLTHWVAALCSLGLLFSGIEVLISHPRFYWGEEGNVKTQPLFSLPIPASRPSVTTGYDFVLPDQNGWSRSLHFESAWILVFTGLLYMISGLLARHFRRHLLPTGSDLKLAFLWKVVLNHLRLKPPSASEAWSYNVLQRLAYLLVVFVLFPLMIWTNLAMSPAIASVFPAIVTVLGGHQSARTIHFLGTGLLVLFVLIHIMMVTLAGFRSRVRAMITGRVDAPKESP
jgi:thiosulfate reductase cytochrome b subunit